MKRTKNILIGLAGWIFLAMLPPSALQAQSKAKIEHVDFFPQGSTLVINYDIVKYKKGETFRIWVNVYTESGSKIIPKALSGDAGNNVAGGSYKRIVWDMAADQAFLDENIAVVVLAESEMFTGGEKSARQKPVEKKDGISVAGAMGLSLLLPGLGRRVVSGRGAAWVLGIAGYGCIGGAFYLNNSAYNAYEDYKLATTPAERDDFYKQAKNQNLYSKILIGAAVTIWVVDLIMTGTKAGKARKSSYRAQKMSFNMGFDPVSRQPLIGLKYRF